MPSKLPVFCGLLLIGKLASGQVELSEFTLTTANDTLWFEYRIEYPADTQFFGQVLLLCTSENQSRVPVISFSDSIRVKGNSAYLHRHPVSENEFLDSLHRQYFHSNGRLPGKEITAFSSLNTRRQFAVNNRMEEKSLRCDFIHTKSTACLVNPVSGFYPDYDSLEVEFRGAGNGESHVYTRRFANSDTLDITPLYEQARSSPNTHGRAQVLLKDLALCETKRIPVAQIKVNAPDAPTIDDLELSVNELPDAGYEAFKKMLRPKVMEGQVTSESRIQSFQYPLSFQPRNYSRLYADLHVNALGLPFRMQSMITTENNANRNLNYFTFAFDKEAWQKNRKLREIALRQYLLSQKQALREKEKELENNLFRESKRLEQLRFTDSLQRLKNGFQLPDTGLSIPINPGDSLQRYRHGLNDSLDNFNRPDSLRPEKPSLDAGIPNMQDSLDKLESNINRLRGLLESLKNTRKKLEQVENKLAALKEGGNPLSYVSQFNVGDFYGNHTPLTLEGIQIRGAQLQLEHAGYSLQLFKGKAIVPSLYISPEFPPQNNYSRIAEGLRVRKQLGDKGIAGVSLLHFKDVPNFAVQNPYESIRNVVLGTELLYSIRPGLKLNAELDFSGLNFLSIPDSFERQRTNTLFSFYEQMAGNLEVEWRIPRTQVETELSVKTIGNNYYSAGVPYLRKGYNEVKLKAKKKFFNKKLNASLSYSLNLDKKSGEKGYTNKIRGYGLQLSTAFRKGPNFLLSYLPFETSSHYYTNPWQNPESGITPIPDQVFKTSVLLLGSYYQCTLGQEALNFSLNYTQSQFKTRESNNLNTGVTLAVSGIHGENMEYGLNYCYIQMTPAQTDSSSQQSLEIGMDYSLPRMKLGTGLSYSRFQADRYLISQGIRASSNVMGIECSLDTGIGWINRGFYAQAPRQTYYCRLLLKYRL